MSWSLMGVKRLKNIKVQKKIMSDGNCFSAYFCSLTFVHSTTANGPEGKLPQRIKK